MSSAGQTPRQASISRPDDDDLRRIARMLDRIQHTFSGLVKAGPNFLPAVLASQFELNWPQAQAQLSDMYIFLVRERSEVDRQQLLEGLSTRGLTGPMLTMKETSLAYYLDRLDRHLFTERPGGGQIFGGTQPAPKWPEKMFGKMFTWFKPAAKVINSFVGSLCSVLPGGLEIFKEFKEHYEAASDIAEALQDGRAEE